MFKITILGHIKSGNKALFKNINSPYIAIENSREMLGADFYEIFYSHHNVETNVSIWCVNGNPRYRSLYPQFLRASKAVIIIFDVSNRESFDSIEYWISLFRQNQIQRPYGFLIGNNIDKNERTVNFEEGLKAAENWGFIYSELSAQSKEDVRNLFENIVIHVVNGFSV